MILEMERMQSGYICDRLWENRPLGVFIETTIQGILCKHVKFLKTLFIAAKTTMSTFAEVFKP